MARQGFNEQYGELDQWFPEKQCPPILCGVCRDGYLSIEKLVKSENTDSLMAHDHDAWEPEWISGLIQAILRCGNPKCKAISVVTGRYRVVFDVDIVMDDHGQQQQVATYTDELKIETIFPSTPIITAPPSAPAILDSLMAEAASIALLSPSAAANRVRTAIDEVLNSYGILRFRVSKRTRRKIRVQTHERIEIFKAKNEEVAELLLAVKWIGNTGSHTDSISLQEALDGAELFSHAIELLYDTKSHELKKKAKKINARKGASKVAK